MLNKDAMGFPIAFCYGIINYIHTFKNILFLSRKVLRFFYIKRNTLRKEESR